ncbi:MAG: VirB8/TrbF family protein [Mycolicibacter sinensis]
MPSRDPAKPGGHGKHAAEGASKDALTLAEAEAKAAEAAAELARARAELLKAQQGSEPESTRTVELETTPDVEVSEAAEPDSGADEGAVEETAEQPRTSTGIWRRLRWVAATLAVLAIGGFLAVDVLMLSHHRDVAQRQHQLGEYAAAARQGVVTLMSLNYETVDDDVKAILDNSTGEFKKDFEAHAGDFTKVARESKTVTTIDTAVAGVESMSDNEAVVLVAATTKVTNTAGAKEEPRSWRLTVHLVREGDQVKMSKVDFAA